MFTQKLLEFKQRHNIPSADKWAEVSGGSKSTIIRALKGDCKDMKVYTLDALLKPYGGSIDELLGIGNYSPEAIEKEELIQILKEVKQKIQYDNIIIKVAGGERRLRVNHLNYINIVKRCLCYHLTDGNMFDG